MQLITGMCVGVKIARVKKNMMMMVDTGLSELLLCKYISWFVINEADNLLWVCRVLRIDQKTLHTLGIGIVQACLILLSQVQESKLVQLSLVMLDIAVNNLTEHINQGVSLEACCGLHPFLCKLLVAHHQDLPAPLDVSDHPVSDAASHDRLLIEDAVNAVLSQCPHHILQYALIIILWDCWREQYKHFSCALGIVWIAISFMLIIYLGHQFF